MKSILLKIGALLMAILVLISTMSFTINMHYCCGTLIDSTILGQVKTCDMDYRNCNIHNISEDNYSILKDGCCENKQIAVEGQDQLRIFFDNIDLNQLLFIVSVVHTSINFISVFEIPNHSINNFLPQSIIAKSIYKLDEAYLI